MNHFTDLWNSSTFGRVELEDAPENGIEFKRDREDAPKELGVLHESTEGAVFKGGALPWVATTSEVDKDDSQTPDIIRRRGVTRVSLGCRCLAFW